MRNVRLVTMWTFVVLGGGVLILAAEARGDEASAKAALAKKGIKATHAGLSLQDETEFTKSVATAAQLRRKQTAANAQQFEAGATNEEADARIAQLTQENAALRARRQGIAQANIVLGSFANQQTIQRIDQQINANDKEIAFLQQQKKQATKPAQEPGKADKPSADDFVQQVFQARKLADRLIDQYAELGKDKEVLDAIGEWNQAAHTASTLRPSHAFESAQSRLEVLEKKIASEKISLRHEGTSYYATVAVNDEKRFDMIVDAEAPTLVLPHQMAIAAGVKVDAAGTKTSVQLADGSKVDAKRVYLKSVRVGSFTAKHVICGVLPEDNTTAKAVLGKSFLGQFKGSVDSGELSLVRGGTESASRKKRTAARHVRKSAKAATTDDTQQ
jgi:clan AA aspartic protease (TIGR02281 family)